MLEAHVLDEVGGGDKDTDSEENVHILVGFVSEFLAGRGIDKKGVGDTTRNKCKNRL